MGHSDHLHFSTAEQSADKHDGADRIPTIIDEEALIRNLFDADPRQGCEVLFQKYYKVLCSHCVRFVHSKEVAEDIVCEIFCKFWSDRIYERITSSYRAYLFKAVRFSAYNYLRWELSKRSQEFDIQLIDLQMNSLQPEETLLLDELSAEIQRTIERLPTQCRRVFMLSRFENKKYLEISAELGISVKAVEAHVSKALDILRTQLRKGDLLSIIMLSHFFEF
jgi:RNA polymerase sigma-70 factor (ECF subfamily)